MTIAASAALVGAGLLLAVPAAAANWTIDPAKSTIAFSGSQTGTPFQGRFQTFSAAIDFDPAKPADGHALVTIDIASAATGDAQRDTALPQSDWFDGARFPHAVFEAKRFTAKGGDRFEATGTLTIRDVKRDVTLPFTFDANGATALVKGHLPLIRTTFGVGQGAWSTPDYVALDVGVDINLVATRSGG